MKTSNAIYEITGEYPVYIRPPFGEWREGLDLAVTMIPVLWDVDSRDWESQNTASICSVVLPNVKDGSIILMHDGYRATVDGQAMETGLGENNRLTVHLPAGTRGELRVWFAGKALWRAADAVSLATLCAMLAVWVRRRRRERA